MTGSGHRSGPTVGRNSVLRRFVFTDQPHHPLADDLSEVDWSFLLLYIIDVILDSKAI